MNRPAFYAALRSGACTLFGSSLSQGQVDTLDAILDEAERLALSISHVAYCMATGYHEVGSKLRPIRENLNYTTASRIHAVWPSRFKSAAAAQPFVRQPKKLAERVYGGRLGNGPEGSGDGWNYRGGGLPQTTGKDNFAKIGKATGVNLVAHPEMILDPKVAVAALVEGSRLGLYTGKKLSDFLPGDYRAARAIINADVKTNGDRIAGYARQFEAALNAGGYSAEKKPVSAPDASPIVPVPGKPEPGPAATGGGLWAAILSILSKLFKGA